MLDNAEKVELLSGQHAYQMEQKMPITAIGMY